MTHAIPDDFPSDSSTTGVLAVGSSLTGHFEHVYDTDWVKLVLAAGTSYVFSMPGQLQSFGSVNDFTNVYLELRGPDGALLWDESGSGGLGPAFEFTSTVAGTYFLATQLRSTDAEKLGSYTLSASLKPAGPDDFADNASTSGRIEVGVKATGTFEFAGDIDWLRFRAEAGKFYSFGTETRAPFVPTADMRIFDSAGNEYPTYPFNPTVTGDYFFSVSSNQPGQYSIVSRLLATDDYSEDNSTTGVLTPGSQITGAIQFRFDTDYIKTTLTAGAQYTFEFAADAMDIPGMNISLRDAAGKYFLLSKLESTGGKVSLAFTAPTSGDYFFVIDGEDLFSGVTRSPYSLKWVGPTVADDFGNDRASAALVALGTTVNGVLDGAADTDFMKVAVEAGKSYTFELKSSEPGMPVSLNISSDNGTLLFVGTGAQNSHTFTAQTSGNYYVSAHTSVIAGAPFSFNASVVKDDFGTTSATAGQLVVGGTASGNLTFGGGDRDWFAVTLTAGGRYSFTTGSADAMSPDAVVIGRILDSSGNPLATSPEWGLNGLNLSFAPTTTGKYFFELYSERDSGAYTVAAKQIPNDDFGHTSATAGRLNENVPQAGALEVMGDRDSFKLAVTAGNQYVIEVKVDAPPDSFGYTDVTVVDSAGVSRVARDSGGGPHGDHYVVVDATSSGDYLITVDGAEGGGVGTYSINAYSVGRDDFGQTVSTSGVVAINGQSKGKLEHIFDEDIFRVSLSAGKTYAFELLGSLGSGGTFDTQNGSTFSLMGGDAMLLDTIATELNRGSPRIQFTARETRDYFLSVGGFDQNDGTYTVKATEVAADAIAPTLAAQWISNGATGVSLTGDMVLAFNEAVKVVGNSIRLREASGIEVPLQFVDPRQSPLEIDNKLVMVPAATLRPGTTYTLDLPAGSVSDYAGNPYAGVKSFTFTTMAISSTASAGNDLLAGFGLGTRIDGGAGIDTALYSQSMASYRVVRSSGDALVIYGNSPAGDTLSGVERLLFADGAIALDINGIAGQAYRLYQAAFDRVPDKDGLGFWIAKMDSGMTLATAASSFVGSHEFKLLYGAAPTDAQFVDLLYDNVLHRKGEQGGIDHWMHALSVGVTRDEVLAAFSESAENQSALASVIGNGFVYNPYG